MASGLTDMEELLERIEDVQIRKFMREALVCYGAGAHRACIVLSFIAVFEDLREKVKVAGGLNADAKAISQGIEKQAEGQKPFETDLVNQLTSKNLLSALQGKRLTQMIDYRNKAAHPSGHYASAEEARFVYFEAIDSYLSKPLLQAKDFAKGVLERLKSSNFFPDSTIENVGNAVSDEMNHLNPAAYPFLVANLVAGVTDTDADFSRNCRMFLTGLAAKKDPTIRGLLAKQLIQAKAIDEKYLDAIAPSITADALVLKSVGTTTQVRVNALLSKAAKDTPSDVPVTRMKHPLQVLRAMVRDLEENELLPHYKTFVTATTERYWANAQLTRLLQSTGEVRSLVLFEYMSRAGSSEFGTANRFAGAVTELDGDLANGLTAIEALTLLTMIWDAAATGAFKSDALRKQKFAGVPNLRKLAIEAIDGGGSEPAGVLELVHMSPEEFKQDWLTDAPEVLDDEEF